MPQCANKVTGNSVDVCGFHVQQGAHIQIAPLMHQLLQTLHSVDAAMFRASASCGASGLHDHRLCCLLLCPSAARASMVLELLKKEVELCKLQADIREQVGNRGGLIAWQLLLVPWV